MPSGRRPVRSRVASNTRSVGVLSCLAVALCGLASCRGEEAPAPEAPTAFAEVDRKPAWFLLDEERRFLLDPEMSITGGFVRADGSVLLWSSQSNTVLVLDTALTALSRFVLDNSRTLLAAAEHSSGGYEVLAQAPLSLLILDSAGAVTQQTEVAYPGRIRSAVFAGGTWYALPADTVGEAAQLMLTISGGALRLTPVAFPGGVLGTGSQGAIVSEVTKPHRVALYGSGDEPLIGGASPTLFDTLTLSVHGNSVDEWKTSIVLPIENGFLQQVSHDAKDWFVFIVYSPEARAFMWPVYGGVSIRFLASDVGRHLLYGIRTDRHEIVQYHWRYEY